MKTLILLILLTGVNTYAQEVAEQEVVEIEVDTNQIISFVCLADLQIANAKEQIEREKEIGKLTGTKNLTALNNAGAVIVDGNRSRKRSLKEYKEATGKDLKTYECE